jgi:hypothetical protein
MATINIKLVSSECHALTANAIRIMSSAPNSIGRMEIVQYAQIGRVYADSVLDGKRLYVDVITGGIFDCNGVSIDGIRKLDMSTLNIVKKKDVLAWIKAADSRTANPMAYNNRRKDEQDDIEGGHEPV